MFLIWNFIIPYEWTWWSNRRGRGRWYRDDGGTELQLFDGQPHIWASDGLSMANIYNLHLFSTVNLI